MNRAAIVSHGKPEMVGDAIERVGSCASGAGVELVDYDDGGEFDIVVVLGGDGTMLRALRGCLTNATPVIGVNFGRVGFLTSIPEDELEAGLRRVFAGDYRVVELCTLRVSVGDRTYPAVNDVVATSSRRGRIVELSWEIGGEDLGQLACDGMVCASPTGSTAYNLSNGGPVMMWGLDAMVITFVAPHAIDVRPLVVPRGLPLRVTNRTSDVGLSLIADGHEVAELGPADCATVGLAEDRSYLALLPEVTFFTRYHDVFV